MCVFLCVRMPFIFHQHQPCLLQHLLLVFCQRQWWVGSHHLCQRLQEVSVFVYVCVCVCLCLCLCVFDNILDCDAYHPYYLVCTSMQQFNILVFLLLSLTDSAVSHPPSVSTLQPRDVQSGSSGKNAYWVSENMMCGVMYVCTTKGVQLNHWKNIRSSGS